MLRLKVPTTSRSAKPPTGSFETEFRLKKSNTKTVTIFGADGATGEHLVAQSLARGFQVKGVVHEGAEALEPRDGLTWHNADVLSDPLGDIINGSTAVLSALGVANDVPTLLDPPPLYTEGTARICDAMKEVGVRRLVVISASFVETVNRGPLAFKLTAVPALARVFAQMADMESQLRDTDVDWTAVRPGWLMDGACTDDYVVQPDAIPEDLIRTRHGDLAHLILTCVEDGSWISATPAIARAEENDDQAIEEIIDEMAP